jgi:hypothetical protein
MKEKYEYEFNSLEKFLNKTVGLWRINRDSIDFKWGYFAPKFGFALKLNHGFYFDKQYRLDFQFLWGYFSILLPFYKKEEPDCEWDSHGFSTDKQSLWIYLGENVKIIYYPFVTLIHDKYEVLTATNKWVKPDGYYPDHNDDRKIETYPYKYVLKSGEIQNRNATIWVERRIYHYKWLKFLRKTFTSLYIVFDDEVGERSGSWKGGVVGCNYDILPNETPYECLKRMESERIFK